MLKTAALKVLFAVSFALLAFALPQSVLAGVCGCDSSNPAYQGACQSAPSETTCSSMTTGFGCFWTSCPADPVVNTPVPANPNPSNCSCVGFGSNSSSACTSAKTETTCQSMSTGFNCVWDCSGSSGDGGNGPGLAKPAPISNSNCVVTYIGDDLSTRANSDNCNGFYTLKSPLGNFGDPNCTLNGSLAQQINKVMNEIQNKDSANVARWQSIIMCESGFNANAYAPIAVNSDAWGLFQMGPSYTTVTPRTPDPGQPADVPGLNGVTDRGDVDWLTQINKAVAHNARSAVPWSYWQCANL